MFINITLHENENVFYSLDLVKLGKFIYSRTW